MQTFLLILVILAAIAALVTLVRGVVVFLMTSQAELNGGAGPSASGLRQNKMMRARVVFQALAILLVVLFLLLAKSG